MKVAKLGWDYTTNALTLVNSTTTPITGLSVSGSTLTCAQAGDYLFFGHASVVIAGSVSNSANVTARVGASYYSNNSTNGVDDGQVNINNTVLNVPANGTITITFHGIYSGVSANVLADLTVQKIN